MDAAESRMRFGAARVARLATVDARLGTVGARPHLVPITFVLLADDTIVTPVDNKPKLTTALQRLSNIEANPQVSVLADHYDDDWAALWWVRADGCGRVLRAGVEPDLRASAAGELASKYAQYRAQPPSGVLIVIAVQRWTAWAASEATPSPARR